jgi:hypothetical protein
MHLLWGGLENGPRCGSDGHPSSRLVSLASLLSAELCEAPNTLLVGGGLRCWRKQTVPFFVGRSNSVRLCYHIDADCRRHASSPRNSQRAQESRLVLRSGQAQFPLNCVSGPNSLKGAWLALAVLTIEAGERVRFFTHTELRPALPHRPTQEVF